MKNNVECPKCLGVGLLYNPVNESEVECNLCKGTKKVSENTNNSYNPLHELEEEDWNYEDDKFRKTTK